MQLLGDVREDEEKGRSYLPEEDRARYPELRDLLAFEADRARHYYAVSAPLVVDFGVRQGKALVFIRGFKVLS